uniref:(California timema) hypothetical protein n=1 Tax=Timema californicum TaxID=61474 RepID=A0A7R9P7L0_TIMCA|nr:unnamed protein product [Timema californicum]
MVSMYLTSSLNNIMGSFNPPLPCLTLPFNITTYILLICVQVWPSGREDILKTDTPNNTTEQINWSQGLSSSWEAFSSSDTDREYSVSDDSLSEETYNSESQSESSTGYDKLSLSSSSQLFAKEA